jgi:hypothetical protein
MENRSTQKNMEKYGKTGEYMVHVFLLVRTWKNNGKKTSQEMT